MKVKEYGYEYDAVRDESLWQKNNDLAAECLDDVFLFRSGRDALKAVAREYTDVVVFMPALACESMILPFQMYNHRLLFYRLTPKFSVDLEDLEHLLLSVKEKILFVYMDYFGNPALEDEQLFKLKEQYSEMIFVEDRTHNLLIPSNRTFCADYTVASLRKWSNIPDGGVMWSQKPLKNTRICWNPHFSTQRLEAQCLRRQFFVTGNQNLKKQYRQIFSTVSNLLDMDKEPGAMSAYAYELAKNTSWDQIRKCRAENAKVLIDILKQCPSVQLIQEQAGLSDLYVAFMVDNRDVIQEELAKQGVFCTIIWPLSNEQINACAVAASANARMLAAPCDQRYSAEDMHYIGSEIMRCING